MRPDAFAAVMATGIVSIAAADHGFHGISDPLAVVAAVVLAVMVIIAAARLRPDIGDLEVLLQLFTFVAACAVVATRLPALHAILGVAAVLAWLVLLPLTARLLRYWPWRFVCTA